MKRYSHDCEEPRCDKCDGRLGHPANGDWTCEKCKLRACRKERIRKDEFDPANDDHFRLQSRGGAWRYYRKVETDPLIYIGNGSYKRRSDCTPADIGQAKRMGSAHNVGAHLMTKLRKLREAAENYLDLSETPRSRKATVAWDALRKAIEESR